MLTEQEYHAHPALSYSKLKVLDECPREFYLRYIACARSSEPTAAMQFGSCLDLAMTEPDKYANLIVKETKTTTIPGCITRDWQTKCNDYIEKLNNYELECVSLQNLFEQCRKQEQLFWIQDGTELRGKLDYLLLTKVGGVIIDLKSTRATTHAEFVKQIWDLHYYLQAATYIRGVTNVHNVPTRFYFVAISTATSEIFCVEASLDMVYWGNLELDMLLAKYKACLLDNSWSTDSEPLHDVVVPQWLQDKITNNHNKYCA